MSECIAKMALARPNVLCNQGLLCVNFLTDFVHWRFDGKVFRSQGGNEARARV